LSVDIKELQELIEEEKIAEEKVRKAKEEAQNILKAAHEKAESIVQAVDSDTSWENLKKARLEEMSRRRAEMEEEYKRKITMDDKTAQQNFEKAVTYVVKETLRVEI